MPRPERPLGPGEGVLLEFAADLRRLRKKAGSPPYRTLARQAHYSATTLSDAARGQRLPSLEVTLAYVRALGGSVDAWQRRWHAVATELAEADASTAGPIDAHGATRPPYVGLASFQVEDAEWFFGRERPVDELLARVGRHRFTAVFGASGAGKSSLLRAGLVAAIGGGRLDAGRRWQAVLFTPGPHPLEVCAAHLARLAGRTVGQIHADLVADRWNLHRTVLEILAHRSSDTDLVLVVDQFEEVFTLCQDRDERAQFITALLTAAEATNSRTRVVLGVRADFYARCSEHPDLVEALVDAQVLIGPMSAEDLRRAITQPAVRADCTVEGSLLAAIVADASAQPGALPLVSHALLETWRRRRGNTLTLAGYQAAGGIRGALSRTAETVYTALTPHQQRFAKELFLRLTALGEGTEDTKRRIDRTELDLNDPDVEVTLHILAASRLITLDDAAVEVAHEALIGAWPRLHQWLVEDRAGLRTHRQLTESAHVWTALDHDLGALYRGARLMIAREWAARNGHGTRLNSAERAFLDASIKMELGEQRAVARRRQQLRYLTSSLAVLLLISTTVGAIAIGQRQEAVHARQIAISRQLAAQALALVDSRPGTAMLLSIEAFRIAPTAEARGALLSMSARQAYQTELEGHTDAISDVDFSPDGSMLASVSKDNTVIIWDARRRTRMATLTGHATWLRAVHFGPGGHLLATTGDDGAVVLWDVESRARLAVLAGHAGPVKDVAFTPDGRTLVTALAEGTVMVWDVAQRKPRTKLTGHTGFVESVAVSPDGHTIASGGADRTVRLWDLRTNAQIATLTGHTRSADAVTFSPDGRTLASASPDQSIVVWDVARRTRLATLTGHTGQVRTVAFSPDGRTLASAGHDYTVMIWDLMRGTALASLKGHTNNIYAVAFNPRLPVLASAGEDGTVILWDPTRVPLAGHTDAVNDLSFDRVGRTLASASTDGRVILWDTGHRTRLSTIVGGSGPANAVALSPDGRTLAVAAGTARQVRGDNDYGVSLWDATDPSAPARLTNLNGHRDQVRDVTFSPDHRILATAGTDRSVLLWDTETRTRRATLTDTFAFNSVIFSPDGRTLATAGHDRTVTLWDATTHTRMATLTGHRGPLRGITFSPDGQTLASSSTDQTVILWNVARRTRQAVLAGNAGPVNALAFSPDGRTLATASTDRAVTLWDLAHATRLATLTGHTGPVRAVAFSPDGTTLASASTDRTVVLWNTDPQQTATRICQALGRNLTPNQWTEFFTGTTYHKTCNDR